MDRSLTASVAEHVLKMQQTEVFVIGDLILDTYVSGNVNRISPEAPVPVLLEKKTWAVLGGAANVAANIAAFGAKTILGGRLGRDTEGERFLQICKDLGIDTSATIQSTHTPTTRKLRVMASYQQLLRIDSEDTSSLVDAESRSLLESFETFAKRSGEKALVISDYGKGVCQPQLLKNLIRTANAAKIPIITDPKSLDLDRYSGSTVMKPNLSEGREVLKGVDPSYHFGNVESDIEMIAKTFLQRSDTRNIVISLSERGVHVQGSDIAKPTRFKSTALQVADVSGAGDTMVAFIALGLAAKLTLARSVELSNIAAGIVCGKLGTSTVTAPEFLDAFNDHTEDTKPDKVFPREELGNLLERARRSGKKIVFTNGCFDLLHVGHTELLQQARSFGDVLVVGLNSDQSVRDLKGPTRPLQSEDDRAHILAALACVDFVTIFDEPTPLELIQRLRPNVLVKGGDYTVDTIVGSQDVLASGGSVEIIPLVKGRSTTNLVKKSAT
jgi:D-beta-D-heptose 7-phosphate kinase/D-beta-D-heptose 1-phosphate adenosyltransferase